MKRALGVATVVLASAIPCAFASMATQAGYVPAGREMLTNRFFDTDASGWSMSSRIRWVEGEGRYGSACLFGDGRGVRRRQIPVQQKVRLAAGAVYRLSFWTRSTDRSSVSANLVRDGRKVRILGKVNETPKQWTRTTYLLSAPETGEYAIQIMLPNTWTSVGGRVWLDDVSLVELGRCEPHDIGSGLYDDYPCAATDSKGNVWLAWLAFDTKGKAERIVVRRHDGKAWSAPRTIRSAGEMFAPAVAAGAKAAWVAWTERVDGNWDIFARRVGPAMGRPIRVTTSPAVDRNVSAAIAANGDVWVAWQSDRNGANDILAAVVNRGPVRPVAVSTYAGSDYNPSAAAVGDKVYVAWDSFRNGNYGVFMKAVESGQPSPLMQITPGRSTENRPHLTVDSKGRLWIAYSVGTIW
ncbi:MAG: TolB family protein, partial [Planctomycetota bacterium]